MEQHQIEVLKEKVSYLRFDGEDNDLLPIVIAHGWGGSSASWVEVATLLQHQGYTVYVPDLPGFGETTMSEVYTTSLYAQFVQSFVTKLAIDAYCLVGHSNGGRISIVTATLDTRLQKLILINSASIAHPPGLKRQLSSTLASIMKCFSWLPGYRFVRKCLYKLVGGHDYLNATNPLLKKTFVNVVHDDAREVMPRVTLPTLIIRGSEDTYTPLDDGKLIHNLIDDSQLVVCEGERHGIHLHNPQLVVDHILPFLS